MATFEPLYYAGGRYSPAVDRKMLSAFVGCDIPTTDADKLVGVIPSPISTALQVSYASVGKLTVAIGDCIIKESSYLLHSSGSVSIGTGDKTFTISSREDYAVGDYVRAQYNSTNYMDGTIKSISPTSVTVNVTSTTGSGSYSSWTVTRLDQDSLYLAGLSTAETAKISFSTPGSTRQDAVWAIVDTTPYFITNKVANGSTATLTTSVNHNFKVDQTVIVSGVDDIFDGSYVITAVGINTFSYAKTATVTTVGVAPTAQYRATLYTVTNKQYSNGVATLTTSGAHSRSVNDFITVSGVGREFDGTYRLVTGTTGSTLVYNTNRVYPDVSSTAITVSSSAVARVPFRIVVDEGYVDSPTTTYNSKSKILLAHTSVTTGGVATVTDKRSFATVNSATQYYLSTTPSGTLTNAPGRFRYNSTTNVFQFYTTAWNSFLSLGTSNTTAAAGNHTHTSGATNFALASHTHSFAAATASEGGAGHPHTTADFTGLGGTVYVDLIAPDNFSYGSTSGSSFTPANTSSYAILTLSNGVPVTSAANFSSETYVLVEISAGVVSDTNNNFAMSIGTTGVTTVAPGAVSGTSSHQDAATDGTAFNEAISSTGSLRHETNFSVSRVFKVAAGTTSFHFYYQSVVAGSPPSSVSITNPTIRVYPLPYGVV